MNDRVKNLKELKQRFTKEKQWMVNYAIKMAELISDPKTSRSKLNVIINNYYSQHYKNYYTDYYRNLSKDAKKKRNQKVTSRNKTNSMMVKRSREMYALHKLLRSNKLSRKTQQELEKEYKKMYGETI